MFDLLFSLIVVPIHVKISVTIPYLITISVLAFIFPVWFHRVDFDYMCWFASVFLEV